MNTKQTPNADAVVEWSAELKTVFVVGNGTKEEPFHFRTQSIQSGIGLALARIRIDMLRLSIDAVFIRHDDAIYEVTGDKITLETTGSSSLFDVYFRQIADYKKERASSSAV